MTAILKATELTGLYDGDGHVREDLDDITDRLSPRYRELKGRLKDAFHYAQLGSIFPPLGHLSSIPLDQQVHGTRDEREHGRTPESWEYFLQAVGIEKTVLYPTAGLTISLVRDHGYVVDLCRVYNDWMADTYLRHPSGKFQAAALLPMQVPEAAVAELRRAVDELGFCSAVLPGQGLINHLGSKMYFPVYEAAQDLDIGLGVHGGVHVGFGMDDFNNFVPVHSLGHPFSDLVSLGAMLFAGVFNRFPNLRVAYLEGGTGWTLMAAERFSESFSAHHPADMETTLQLRPRQKVSDYMGELMQAGRMVIGCEGGEDFIETAMEYFGSSSFMYSSDFPHEVSVASCKHELEELSELKISDEAKANLRGGTARKFYKLG